LCAISQRIYSLGKGRVANTGTSTWTKQTNPIKIIPTGRYFKEGQVQLRSEGTHARLLAAAQQCFARHGFDATGVALICSVAGVSKGAFYHHFPSKQAIFLELLQEWLAEIETRLETVRQEAQNAPQALLQMSSMVGQVFQAAYDQLPIFLEFWTQSSRDADVWQATIAPYHRFQDFFTALIRQGVSEGSFRAIEPEGAARLVLSQVLGVIFQGLLDPKAVDWEATIHQGLLIFLENWREKAG
jgi:AcrR family transcriptional regulator